MDARGAIVVGAGTAGCVVARRLADAGLRVVVLEAGPGEPRPASITGADIIAAAEEPGWQWQNVSARSADEVVSPHDRQSRYRQGHGIGGGSAINAMLLAPGDRSDYDRWSEEFECAGWTGTEFAPWLRRAAADANAETVPSGPVTDAFAAAALAAGHPHGGSSLEQDRLGLLDACLSIDGAGRQSAFDRYLAPALGSDAVELRTSTSVRRILVSDNRANGVVVEDGTVLNASKVVLCGGAVQNPLLLTRSGLATPQIGATLQDHPSFVFTIALQNPSIVRHRRISQLLRWSSANDGSGDLQAFVIDRVDGGEAQEPAFAVVIVGLMDVASTGSVRVNPVDGKTVVTTGALREEEDRRRLRAGVRHIRRLLADPATADVVAQVFIDDQGTPVEQMDAMTDDQLDRWLIDHPGPYAHPSGTCQMGPPDRETSVVSHLPEDGGRMVGCTDLHIIDASIMPRLVRAGLQLPVTAMAERLTAGLLLQ